jgi:hypothetical protein
MRSQSSSLPDLNPWVVYVEMLCSQLGGLFDRIEVIRLTFQWAVDSFTFILRLFGENINRFVSQARTISEKDPNSIQKHSKEDYNTIRFTYVGFLDNYSAFLEDLNKRFRTREMTYSNRQGSYTETDFRSVYVEKPKEL